jgi:hypothetical protein
MRGSGNVGRSDVKSKKNNSHTNVRTMSLPPREMMITSSDCKRRDELAPKEEKQKLVTGKRGLTVTLASTNASCGSKLHSSNKLTIRLG